MDINSFLSLIIHFSDQIYVKADSAQVRPVFVHKRSVFARFHSACHFRQKTPAHRKGPLSGRPLFKFSSSGTASQPFDRSPSELSCIFWISS